MRSHLMQETSESQLISSITIQDKHVTNIGRSMHSHLTLAHKQYLPPSDSQCKQKSPLCLCPFKVGLMWLSPLWLIKYSLYKLQRVQNSSAKWVIKSCKYDRVQPLLHNPHWLPVLSRTDYKDFNLVLQHFHWLLSCLISLSFYPPTPLPGTFIHPQTHARSVFLSSKLLMLSGWVTYI